MAARSRRDVQAFAEVNAANWTPPDSQVLRFYDLAADALCTAGAPLRLYVGYLDGQPVATAEVTAGGGVVGVYNVATRAAWRRRGIAGALLRVALRGARSAGARTAVLQAAPDGVGVYERLGFQAFGRVTEYKPQE
jgi:ribosomal protein S18 acetylase RimI-like enzyme